MVDIKKDDDLARPSRTLAHPRRPSFNLATLATLAYTLHLADSNLMAVSQIKNQNKISNLGPKITHDGKNSKRKSSNHPQFYLAPFPNGTNGTNPLGLPY